MPPPPPPPPTPQHIHLGAVSHAHNHTPYAVRGRIAFDFRDTSGNLVSLRLHSIIPPASPAAVPTAIDVLLRGRWRVAAAPLRKHALVQVDCALVRPATDLDVNALRLELCDPMPGTSAALAAIHLLNDDLAALSTVSFPALSAGMVPSRAGAAGPAAAPWSPRRARPARVSVGESVREYVYTPIAELWKRTAAPATMPRADEKFNVYGVVIDCRAPCTTRGPDLRCEVVVADESSLLNPHDPSSLKTMSIYQFEKNPADCIPFRSVGDIIRAHRVNVGRHRDYVTGGSTLQGIGRFYSTFLLWSYEGTDFLPVASRDPVRVSSSDSGALRSVTHLVTPQDREKISALRGWARNYFFKTHKIHRPFLRTVLEVKSADGNAEFLTKSFDLICCFEGEIPDHTNQGALKFVVSDGLLDKSAGGQRLLVESELSAEHLQRSPYRFIDFCPSWEGKPNELPGWLLIRDAQISARGSDRTIQLSVGKKTSTLVWHPENSPDVRHVKEKFDKAKTVNAARTLHHQAVTGASALNHTTGQLPQLQSIAQHPQSGPAVPQGQAFGLQVPPALAPRNLLKRPARALFAAGAPLATTPPLRKVPRTERVGTDSGRGNKGVLEPTRNRFDESTAATLQRDLDAMMTTITRHPNQNFKVSTILEMLQAVSNGKLGPHRLQVSARSCISPRDVRFACRPWCNRCSRFLKIDPNHRLLECLSCSDKYSNTGDPRTQWAYSVRLNIEDGSGARTECWIDGKEGTQFFAGLDPTNLLSNTEARQRVSKCLKTLLSPKSRLDCCVKPYEYQDKHGVYRTSCKLFATELLPEVVAD